MAGTGRPISMFEHLPPPPPLMGGTIGIAKGETPVPALGSMLENVVAVAPEDAFDAEDVNTNTTEITDAKMNGMVAESTPTGVHPQADDGPLLSTLVHSTGEGSGNVG